MCREAEEMIFALSANEIVQTRRALYIFERTQQFFGAERKQDIAACLASTAAQTFDLSRRRTPALNLHFSLWRNHFLNHVFHQKRPSASSAKNAFQINARTMKWAINLNFQSPVELLPVVNIIMV